MAIQILAPTTRPWRVTTYMPNEKETDVLGGSHGHSYIGFNFVQTLRTFALRHGLIWLVEFENELRYRRTDGSTGTLYPDVQFAPGISLNLFKGYDVEAIGRPPALIVEILSTKTAHRDVGLKRTAYAELGVEEYVTFDPRPRKKLALHGYRLISQGQYREISRTSTGGLWLAGLGMEVKAEAPLGLIQPPLLRLSTRDGERLLHMDEEAEARDDAEQARDDAEQARDDAEQARNAAERAWATEREAREAAEQAYGAEVARLRALLEESGRDPMSGHE
jgi:Uma2 family endonuclease